MSDPRTDPQLDEFLEIRKPGAHLEDGVIADDFVLMLGVDLINFPKFSRVDDGVTYAKAGLDIRQQLDVDSGAELPDYGGPYRADLRFTDFSKEALATKFLPWSERYLQLCVDGWATEVAKRYGAETMAEIEWTAWNDQSRPRARSHEERVPACRHPLRRPEPARRRGGSGRHPCRLHRAVHAGPERRRPLQSATGHVVPRESRVPPAMHRSVGHPDRCAVLRSTRCSTSSGRCGATSVLPGVKKLKAEYLGISGNTVEDWMKDLQIDATALPGKAFDLSFEMPEPEVGIMTFNRCVAVDQWEAMGRPDILEKNCHSTCPKSMIETTAMYNPNMKVDILAIPPRVDPGDVCCKWRFSMRSEDDPEYVPVDLTTKPDPSQH